MIGWTKLFGGDGGNDFEYLDLNAELVGFSGSNYFNQQDTISQFSFTFRNAQGVERVVGPLGWGVGNQGKSWRVSEGEYISKFTVTYNRYVNSLQF